MHIGGRALAIGIIRSPTACRRFCFGHRFEVSRNFLPLASLGCHVAGELSGRYGLISCAQKRVTFSFDQGLIIQASKPHDFLRHTAYRRGRCRLLGGAVISRGRGFHGKMQRFMWRGELVVPAARSHWHWYRKISTMFISEAEHSSRGSVNFTYCGRKTYVAVAVRSVRGGVAR